jgi:hypothetical protein
MFSRITLDIETRHATDSELALEARFLKPSGNCKTEASQAKSLREKQENLAEKSALTDACQIGCVGLFCDGRQLLSFTSFPVYNSFEYSVVNGASERVMIMNLGMFLEGATDAATQLVTFNGRGFDIPKLRLAFARNGVRMPDILRPFSSPIHTDVMRLYGKYYSIKEYVSLDEVVAQLGIDTTPIMSGADDPDAIENGQGEAVVLYNLLDCILTDLAYCRLLGGS